MEHRRRRAAKSATPWLLASRAASVLRSPSAQWTARADALRDLVDCANSVNDDQHAEQLTEQLSTLAEPLAKCIADLRSALVRQTCDTIVALANALGRRLAEAAAEELMPALLRRAGTRKLVMRESAATAAHAVLSLGSVGFSRAAALHLVAVNLDRNAPGSVRAAASVYVGVLLRNSCPALLELGSELNSSIRVGCSDAEGAVRSASRDNLLALRSLDRARYDVIFEALGKKVQTLVSQSVCDASAPGELVSKRQQEPPTMAKKAWHVQSTPATKPATPASARPRVAAQRPMSLAARPPRLHQERKQQRSVVVKEEERVASVALPQTVPEDAPIIFARTNLIQQNLTARRRESWVRLQQDGDAGKENGTMNGKAKVAGPRRSVAQGRMPLQPSNRPLVNQLPRDDLKHMAAFGPPRRNNSLAPRRSVAQKAPTIARRPTVATVRAENPRPRVPLSRRPTVHPMSRVEVAEPEPAVEKATQAPTLSSKPTSKAVVAKPAVPATRRSAAPAPCRPWNLPPPPAAIARTRTARNSVAPVTKRRVERKSTTVTRRGKSLAAGMAEKFEELSIVGKEKDRGMDGCGKDQSAKASLLEDTKHNDAIAECNETAEDAQEARAASASTSSFLRLSDFGNSSQCITQSATIRGGELHFDSSSKDCNTRSSKAVDTIASKCDEHSQKRRSKSLTHSSRRATAKASVTTFDEELLFGDMMSFGTGAGSGSDVTLKTPGGPRKARISFLLGPDVTPRAPTTSEASTLSETADNSQVRFRSHQFEETTAAHSHKSPSSCASNVSTSQAKVRACLARKSVGAPLRGDAAFKPRRVPLLEHSL